MNTSISTIFFQLKQISLGHNEPTAIIQYKDFKTGFLYSYVFDRQGKKKS